MTRKGGTSQACASCRYQRRRCKSDCPLAPYFPADQPDMFHNAHRLFGVSNITKLLKQIDPNLRGVAMKSIIEEANARAKYPVYGCVAEIQQLMLKIQLAEEELMAVHSQLAFYTQQQRPDHHHHQPDNNPLLPCLQLGTAATVVNPSPPSQYTAAAAAIPVSQNNPSTYFNAYANTDNSRDNACWVQQLYENGNGGNSSNNNNNNNDNINNNNNQMVMMVQQEVAEMGLGSGQRPAPPQEQPITIQVQGNIEDDDYDEMMYPFFDTIDDRQSYIESKEPYESSSESSFKDIAQSVSENELKNAAACFTLTSINV